MKIFSALIGLLLLTGVAFADECTTTSKAEISAKAAAIGASEQVLSPSELKTFLETFGDPGVEFDTLSIYILPEGDLAIVMLYKDGCATGQARFPVSIIKAFLDKHKAGQGGNNG